MRLTELAYNLGLAKKDRYILLKEKHEAIESIINFTKNHSVKPEYMNTILEQFGTTPIKQGCKLIDIINRPQITVKNIAEYIPELKNELNKLKENRKEEITEAVEILIKYQGYINREKIIANKLTRLENIIIKDKFDYTHIQSLSTEARQKLVKINPETIAQASRIPGISPNDINVLLVLSGR
jgi:tRNA uridine 5-carboxymethylaminomethyl modification enzyme